jgi:tight adherence protein B
MLTWILIIGGVLVLGLLIVGIIVSATGERTLVEERLEQYLEEEKTEEQKKAERAVLTEWVSKRMERTSFGDNIARELARADIKFKVAEYFVLIFFSIIGVSAIAGFLGGRHPVSFMIGGVVGALLPRMYVRRKQRQRLVRFDEQLSDMLNLMVNGLRAGYSTVMAMEAVSKELPPPISDEFRRVVQEMQIGIPMERALDNLLRRIPSTDLDFVITAINVQREVGGNLSEILDTISFTIRERVRIKGEVRVLTAQVRTSGTILALMPIALVSILWFLNRAYMMTFFLKGVLCGAAALGLAGMLIAVGYFVMMRIADIEV